MRILIITVGSTGDVRPYAALGRALRSCDHEVTIATHPCFEDLVKIAGVSFWPVFGDPAQIIRSELGVRWLHSGGSSLRFGLGLRKLLRMLAVRTGVDCWEAAQGKDVIIASRLAIGVAFHVAEKLGIPLIPAYLQPSFATREFPEMYVFKEQAGPFLNRISYDISMWFFWLSIQREASTLRTEVIGLPKLSARETVRRVTNLSSPKLVAISPHVIPKPSDWGNDFHMTGYWFLPDIDWEPDSTLVDFLNSGSPPVCVGFGSMNNEDRATLGQTVIRTLRESRCRGVLLTGWGGLAETGRHDDILVIPEAPHTWLYPRVAAVVHHAGAGTSAACLRAGIPAVPVPYFADQFYWGRKLHALGVATEPIPRRGLTQDRLRSAIHRVTSDQTMSTQAKEIARKMQNEDGARNAAAIINDYILRGTIARPRLSKVANS